MRIAVIGRGNVGGGLGDLWEKAGHEVTRIGKEGGDVSEAEAVLVAVPGGAIEAALDSTDRVSIECRVREVENQRTDGEIVQREWRPSLQ